MPSGYTASLHEGEQSFEDYAMGVARAFGALITMRDDPQDAEIPQVFEPAGYYLTAVQKTRADRDRLYGMTLEEAGQAQDEEISKAQEYAAKYVADKRTLQARYEAMLERARAYVPPTPEHKGFAEMLVTQLEESIRFDCGDYSPKVPERREAAVWLAEMITRAEQSVERAEVALEDEVRRAKERTEWVSALRESLVGERVR